MGHAELSKHLDHRRRAHHLPSVYRDLNPDEAAMWSASFKGQQDPEMPISQWAWQWGENRRG